MRTYLVLLCLSLVVLSLTVEASAFHRDNKSLTLERRNAKLSNKHRNMVVDDDNKEAFSLRGGEKSKGGTASMTAMVFNLVNNVAGTHSRCIRNEPPGRASLITKLCVCVCVYVCVCVCVCFHSICRCRNSLASGRSSQRYGLVPRDCHFYSSWIDFGTDLLHGWRSL